jgi:hypothetical protein
MWRAVLVAMLVLAPSARADVWRGQTSQGRPASVMTGGDGVVSRVRLSWRAPCGSHHRFASASVLLPPFASASASSVADAGTYRVTDRRGLHARITVRVVGALGSSDWTGTLGVAVMVSHRGKVVDTCRASRLTWSAAPVG